MLGNTKARVTALVLVLVVGLAALGVAYGHWTKVLDIDGTVNTGDLDAGFTQARSDDPDDSIDPGKDKHVGRLDCYVDGLDPQILHFDVTNGYPSYEADCQVEYTNTGTIPWVVEDITFVEGTNLTGCTVNQSPTTGSFVASCDQLTVTFVDGLCTQIDPGDPWGIASSVRVHVEQNAEELTQYGFDVEILLMQWNETACP